MQDKWGPAGAIPVAIPREGEENGPTQERKTVTVTVTNPQGSVMEAVLAAAKAKARLTTNQKIRSAQVRSAEVKTKAVAVAPKAKNVTRFIVSDTEHSTWETGFDTQAEARAHAVATAATPAGMRLYDLQPKTFHITSVTRRETGEALVSVEQKVTKVTAEVEIWISTTPPVPNRVDGWLFFGYASS